MSELDIDQVLRDLPRFERFCSVAKLRGAVESLRGNHHFAVEVAGESGNGIPIEHVTTGKGAVKVLVVGYPHCMEPIGSLAVHSLMSLLGQRNAALLGANVEWHILPCIDPDGALLNEGWSQQPFSLESYMRNYYVQTPRHQADMSLPFEHKKVSWQQPSREARILQGILDRVRPDFLYSLHNARPACGSFFLTTRDLGEGCNQRLLRLVKECDIPLNETAPRMGGYVRIAEGVYEIGSIREVYDYFERAGDVAPEKVLEDVGCGGPEYLQSIHPEAVSFIAELDYVRLPADGLGADTKIRLRQLKLRIDAENKFLASTMLEAWDDLHDDLDPESPFYRKFVEELVNRRHRIHEELPLMWSFEQTRNLMFNPAYRGTVSERDRMYIWLWSRFMPMCNAYGFVRALKAGRRTDRLRKAIERMESIFEEALDELRREVDFRLLTPIDCNVLARASVGSGLIALNSVLKERS